MNTWALMGVFIVLPIVLGVLAAYLVGKWE
jgi:preprotein translocase subunit SecG